MAVGGGSFARIHWRRPVFRRARIPGSVGVKGTRDEALVIDHGAWQGKCPAGLAASAAGQER